MTPDREVRRCRRTQRRAAGSAGRALAGGFAIAWVAVAPGAEDWPSFRHDNRRSGATSESPSFPLRLVWTHRPPLPPAPAWPAPAATNYAVMHGPLQPTLTFDRTHHAVANAEAVFYASSGDDSVCCLDARTGAERWRFTTEGPVRLPPALSGRLVLAGSDDGCLYGLDAATGRPAWKRRIGPDDRRLPGNGRMISLWPVRGGLLVDGGAVHAAAGLFPEHGVFLGAFDAATGEPRRTRALPFPAQGIMLASADRLFVATGRTSYWTCDLASGEPMVRHGVPDPWKSNLVGGCFAVLSDGVLATGPSEDGRIHWFAPMSKDPVVAVPGDCLIVDGEVAFLLGRGKVAALPRAGLPGRGAARRLPEPLWSAGAEGAITMIRAGDAVVTAGTNSIRAYAARDGAPVWSAAVDGIVEGLAFARGRLLASLDNGDLLCFAAAGTAAAPPPPRPASADLEPAPLLADAAAAAVAFAASSNGYCLVLQSGSGRLALEIARRSAYQIVCRESDPALVAASRELLRRHGVYGSRVAVHEGGPEIPYPRGFANLVVSERALTRGDPPPPAAAVERALRPCGGAVRVAAPAGSEAGRRLAEWVRALPEGRIVDGEPRVATARRGPVTGGGEWTHFYADPANTACSDDEMPPGPMELQWFGRPGPAGMVDRHKKGPAPLYADGRLFVPGYDCLIAVDAYNGFILWERAIPESVRVGAFKDCSSIATDGPRVYVAAGDQCLVLDAESGRTLRTVPVPAGPPDSSWGYVAVANGRLIGSAARPGGSMRHMTKLEDQIIWRNVQPIVCSTAIFAVDPATGRRLWTYPARRGLIANPSLTIGGERVCFIESANAATLESADGRVPIPELVGRGARLVALDLASGAVRWDADADLGSIEHVLFMSYAAETLLVSGSRYAEVPPSETVGRPKPLQSRRVRYDLFAFDAATGRRRWARTFAPNYDHVLDGAHGEQVQHPAIVGGIVYGPDFACHLSTGEPYAGARWEKSHKCATVSASRHCAFSRFAEEKLPYQFDLRGGERRPLTQATRPGCWINIIPAGGLVLIPEASAGCTCPYAFQASLALRPAER